MLYFAIACRVLIGLVFAVSAGSKLRGQQSFAAFVVALRALAPMPFRPARAVAVAVVVLEAGIAAALAHPATARAALLVAGTALVGFAGALAVAVRRGVTSPCRCFGASSTPPGPEQIVRNVLLAVAAFGGAGALEYHGTPAPPGVALAAFAGVVAALVAMSADDVAALLRAVQGAHGRNDRAAPGRPM